MVKKIAPTELLSWVHKDIIQLAKILRIRFLFRFQLSELCPYFYGFYFSITKILVKILDNIDENVFKVILIKFEKWRIPCIEPKSVASILTLPHQKLHLANKMSLKYGMYQTSDNHFHQEEHSFQLSSYNVCYIHLIIVPQYIQQYFQWCKQHYQLNTFFLCISFYFCT